MSKSHYFLDFYKKRGFINGQALTSCNREVFDIARGQIENMLWETYDHELISPFCDINAASEKNAYSILVGSNSIRKRCLYGKNIYEYSLDYLRQFFEVYKNENKLFRLGLFDGHEGSNEVIKYSDQRLFDFFTNFEKDSLMDDTTVFIQADHGLAMLGPYSAFKLEDYLHELVLPTFFVIIPTSMESYEEVADTMDFNQNSLVTPFNLYNSILSILRKPSNAETTSPYNKLDIFRSKIDKSINCLSFYDEDYYSDNESICRCSG